MEGLSTEKDNCKERKRIDMFRETNKKPYTKSFAGILPEFAQFCDLT